MQMGQCLLFLLVGSARRAALPVLFLLTDQFLGFSHCTNQGEIWQGGAERSGRTIGPLLPAKFHLDRFRGVDLRPPKLKKFGILPIYSYQSICIILTKFTGFMCVLSLHKSAKFGCFISISDKIINNLPRWDRFQPNFRWPLRQNYWWDPKKVWGEMMARTTSIIMQNLVEIERRTLAWENKVWCFSL